MEGATVIVTHLDLHRNKSRRPGNFVPTAPGIIDACWLFGEFKGFLRLVRHRRGCGGVRRDVEGDVPTRLLRLVRRGGRHPPVVRFSGLREADSLPYRVFRHREGLADQSLLAEEGAKTPDRLLLRGGQLQLRVCRVELTLEDQHGLGLVVFVLLRAAEGVGPYRLLPHKLQLVGKSAQLPCDKIRLTGGVAAALGLHDKRTAVLRLVRHRRGGHGGNGPLRLLRQGGGREQAEEHEKRHQQTQITFAGFHTDILPHP